MQSSLCILDGEFPDPRRWSQNPQMLKSVMWNVLVFLRNLYTPSCIVKSCLYGLQRQIQCEGEVIGLYNVEFREKWQEIKFVHYTYDFFKINFDMELGESSCRVHAERGCLQFFFRCLELNICLFFSLPCWLHYLLIKPLIHYLYFTRIWNVDIETCPSVPT